MVDKTVDGRAGKSVRRKERETEARSVDVVDASNAKVGELDLAPDVFGVPVNEHLMYEAVKEYRATGRRGTHMTKTRGLVSASGHKPWRQKGTGRARVNESSTPLWRSGGTVFGPQPRDYSYSMPKKARAGALRCALSQKVSDGAVKVLDHFPEIQAVEAGKPGLTKQLVQFLDGLKVQGKALVVESDPSIELLLSGRNIPGLKIVDSSAVNIYDVLASQALVFSKEALSRLEERLQR